MRSTSKLVKWTKKHRLYHRYRRTGASPSSGTRRLFPHKRQLLFLIFPSFFPPFPFHSLLRPRAFAGFAGGVIFRTNRRCARPSRRPHRSSRRPSFHAPLCFSEDRRSSSVKFLPSGHSISVMLWPDRRKTSPVCLCTIYSIINAGYHVHRGEARMGVGECAFR